MIDPHGGYLVDRIIYEDDKQRYINKCKNLHKLILNKNQLIELENIATGLYSPLEGFMNKKDYESVIKNMRLNNGEVWTMPIVLDVDEGIASNLKINSEIALIDKNKKLYGTLYLKEKYKYNKEKEAKLVYQTTDKNHPGIANLYKRKEILLGGNITLINRIEYNNFLIYRIDPKYTREYFKNKNWKTIVGFQTRNPIHRAHEYLQKCALEIVDGLFISPLIGQTKSDDVPLEYRLKSYEEVINKIYPASRAMMSVFPVAMRYAGPKEAIFHAICRKNYGCTHFIIGRDHAGVGNYYGTYDAQKIFDNFTKEEIGITPLKFDHAFYCKKCESMATIKTCPHSRQEHIFLSGTKVRELLQQGIKPPKEITRLEVSKILIESYQNKG